MKSKRVVMSSKAMTKAHFGTQFEIGEQSKGRVGEGTPARAIFAPYAFTIFLGAFLLFQVQPIIARYILPWYGGSPAVWTTCLLFFQVLLLAGYTYSHLLASFLTPRRQLITHITLLGLSFVFLPITPGEALKPDGHQDPVYGIITLLLFTVGAPYLLVSASGPLFQHLFSRSHPGVSPYRLYALSNLGSLLGLLIYPFVLELYLPLSMQTVLWSIGYGLYASVCGWCAISMFRLPTEPASIDRPSRQDGEKASSENKLLWLLLSACGSVVLLASTNQMSQDVAVIPFLWILPLSLYLISFIICFDNTRWYHRAVWVPLLLLSMSAVVYLLHQDYAGERMDLFLQITIYSAALFTCCMICHGELVRLKPPSSGLTSFYLLVALGGALGGGFVNLVAPYLFDGYWELHVGLMGTCVLSGLCIFRKIKMAGSSEDQLTGLVSWATGAVMLIVVLNLHIRESKTASIVARRNFYGVLNVYEHPGDENTHMHSLYNGRINHGNQYQSGELRLRPTTYFGFTSGIGLAIRYHPMRRPPISSAAGISSASSPGKRGLHVGGIGLGTGTIAAYSRKGDTFRFYEINPEVVKISRKFFTYLKDAAGDEAVILGDGRISLERELRDGGPQQFDVLAVDAFSGDAIPIHLLTEEAFDLYWKHLRPDGILAVHISNLYLDLSSVVRVLARKYEKQAVFISDEANTAPGTDNSDWVLITNNEEFLNCKDIKSCITPWTTAEPKPVLWTDDYSNLLRVIRE